MHERSFVDAAVAVIGLFVARNVFITGPYEISKRFPLGVVRPIFARLHSVNAVTAVSIGEIKIFFARYGVDVRVNVNGNKHVVITFFCRSGRVQIFVSYKRTG